MMTKVANGFGVSLLREIEEIETQFGLDPHRAFVFWFATRILELSETASLEALSIEGANDKGIDLFYVDDDEGKVTVVQGKFTKSLNHKASIGPVDKLKSSIAWLESPEACEKDGRSELAEAAREYVQAIEQGFGVDLVYVYAGKKSVNVDKHIRVLNQSRDNQEKNIFFRHYHVELLEDYWKEIQGGQIRIQRERIASLGEPVSTSGTFGSALVLTAPGAEIVRLYREYGDKLFDRNVRLFLGSRKGSVNAGIAETLRDAQDRENFWAYNNGITIICDEVHSEGSEVELVNFNIVNGCQTAVSLAENEGDQKGVSVLVRCIAAAGGILENVIRFTNSQNPIRTWDLASQQLTQRKLHKEFQELKKPYIYLTRRGSKPTGDLRKYRENGKLRQIRIDSAGQYMAAFRGRPVLAYKHKAFIFSRYHDEVFPRDVGVVEVLLACIFGDICASVTVNLIREGTDDARILKKGGHLFVLAVASSIARERNGDFYVSSLREDQITSKKGKDRLLKYSKFAAMLYLSAVQDLLEMNEKMELTTLIRQADYFEKVHERAIRQYKLHALNENWLKGTLPKLI